MLLINPPLAKPCEPPAGIARLAGVLRGNGHQCTLLDANIEGLLNLLTIPKVHTDTWSIRAGRSLESHLTSLRTLALYENFDRYQRAVLDVNRVLEQGAKESLLSLSLANYQQPSLSPLKSDDLLRASELYDENLFYPYFSIRLQALLEEKNPSMVGFSLNYLSQAICTFSMIGFLKKRCPGLPVVMGGGLVTSWLRSPSWRNPFAGIVDYLIAGPGEKPLLKLMDNRANSDYHAPDYAGLPTSDYLSPGFILPYSASSGCYWNKCSFCPEKAEDNPYISIPTGQAVNDIFNLTRKTRPVLLHLLDNAISSALMQKIAINPPAVQWYGFARVSSILADADFCRQLKRSGCVMLKLGLESGDQGVLDEMNKGIDLGLVSKVLRALQKAGIATYVYLLFGTPSETIEEARRTMKFVVKHYGAITFLNLAIFNMPIGSSEAKELAVSRFYEGDLSLYTDFTHPKGWNRKDVRQFLDKEFKRQPLIAQIIKRDPPHFTSNHAPFFVNKV